MHESVNPEVTCPAVTAILYVKPALLGTRSNGDTGLRCTLQFIMVVVAIVACLTGATIAFS